MNTAWSVKLRQPSEVILDILPIPQKGPFFKNDAEPLVDSQGHRVHAR